MSHAKTALEIPLELRTKTSAHMDQHLSDMLADDMLETLYHHFTACLAEYPTVFSEDIRRTANDLGERKHIDDLVRLFNESPEHLQKLVRVSTSGSPHNEHHVDQSIDQEDS